MQNGTEGLGLSGMLEVVDADCRYEEQDERQGEEQNKFFWQSTNALRNLSEALL